MPERLKQFTDKLLKSRDAGAGYLQLNLVPEQLTYFDTPDQIEYSSLSSIPFEDHAALAAYLGDRWQKYPELQALIPEMMDLFRSLTLPDQHKSGELPSFVYTMY